MSTGPDAFYPDPAIQRLVDWLKRQFTRVDALETNTGGLRIVRGVIDGTGTAAILEGDGFTLADNGTGDYTITFDPVFSDVPSANITTSTSGVGRLTAASASAISVLTFNPATGASLDADFHFIAIGPA